jgi:hypothetical protein
MSLYTLFSRRDLRTFYRTASVEGHTRREAGPQSHSSCSKIEQGKRAGLPGLVGA